MKKQNVTVNLGDAGIKKTDIKVDTSPENEEEQKVQNQVLNAMDNNGLTQDETTVGDTSAEENEEKKEDNGDDDQNIPTNNDFGDVDVNEEEKEEGSEEEKEEGSEEEKEEGSEEEKEEGSEEEKEELSKEDYEKKLQEAKESAKEEALDEFMQKYKPNEQKSENIRLNNELKKKNQSMDTSQYLVTEKQIEIYNKFFDNHKDILPEESKKKLTEYQKTGDSELIFSNPNLRKLNDRMQTIAQINPENPLVDLEDRLEAAFWLSHKDEILNSREKQIKVKTEMEKQEEDKIVESGEKPSQPKSKKTFSEEQQKVANTWGVKLN